MLIDNLKDIQLLKNALDNYIKTLEKTIPESKNSGLPAKIIADLEFELNRSRELLNLADGQADEILKEIAKFVV